MIEENSENDILQHKPILELLYIGIDSERIDFINNAENKRRLSLLFKNGNLTVVGVALILGMLERPLPRAAFLSAMKENISNIITDLFELKTILMILPNEEHIVFIDTIKEKLPTIIGTGATDIFEMASGLLDTFRTFSPQECAAFINAIKAHLNQTFEDRVVEAQTVFVSLLEDENCSSEGEPSLKRVRSTAFISAMPYHIKVDIFVPHGPKTLAEFISKDIVKQLFPQQTDEQVVDAIKAEYKTLRNQNYFSFLFKKELFQ